MSMDRRSFVESCAAGAGCLSAATLSAIPGFAASLPDVRPKPYARSLLIDEQGQALRSASLKPHFNYVFHYPFEATPVFLLNMEQPVLPQRLTTSAQASYAWPGGVGLHRSVVAFSAICAHQLVYPTPQVSFISFRKKRSSRGVQDNLIHCCADHSQYDPAQGAKVLHGPAAQPLCAVLLEHDPKLDTLTAYATLGGELFDEFFRKYEFNLNLDLGPRAASRVSQQTVVRALDKYCRNAIQC